jgi:hypothetical protein
MRRRQVFVVVVFDIPGETSSPELSLLPGVYPNTLRVAALFTPLAFDPDTGQTVSLGYGTPQFMGARLSKLAATCARQPVVVGLVSMLDDKLLRSEKSLFNLCLPAGVRRARSLVVVNGDVSLG